MSFKDLDLRIQYRSNKDKAIIDGFYIPILKKSIIYKRAVGFFSSSSLISISKGISKLLENGGSMQLIISPRLSREDIEAMERGYISRQALIDRNIIDKFYDAENYIERERYNYLANLIANNQLDIKIAILKSYNPIAMYHEKIGIMSDEEGNKIAFTGSMNESEFSYVENFESIDVYCSWNNFIDSERVNTKEKDFDDMWSNSTDKLYVYDFPEGLKEKILKYKKNDMLIEEELEVYMGRDSDIDKEKTLNEIDIPRIPEWFSIRPYQNEAYEAWKHNEFIGLLNMATGTGKTLTALAAMTNLYNELENKELIVIIVCPYTHLVEQWKEDIEKFNIKPLVAYSDARYKDWDRKVSKMIHRIRLGMKNFGCIVTTNSTYRTNKFQEVINKCSNKTLIVIDEAHNAGAEGFSKYLLEKFRYRLALSATPNRANDEEGTDKIISYFSKEVYNFSLERAIEEGYLTKYYYYPQIIYLTEDERKEYQELSKKISKFFDVKTGKLKKNSAIEILLIKRARIIAGAENKILKLRELLKNKKDSNYNLIYCGATTTNYSESEEDIRQIDAVSNLLGNEFNMRIARFTSEETMEERKTIIDNFSDGRTLQAIIAIKCLDEGVNIPSIKNAYILASSTNPREFIQRRGRVLRQFEGKDYAYIYDFITLPRSKEEIMSANDNELKNDISLIKKELKRVKEFANLAENKRKSMYDIKDILEFYDSLIIN